MASDLARVRGRALQAVEEMVRVLADADVHGHGALALVLGSVLARHVDAQVALLLRVDLVHHDTVVLGPATTAESDAVIRHHLRHHAHEDPLTTTLSNGSLRPRSARRELGPAWERSPAYRFASEHFGVGEFASVPLHGSPEGYAVYLLGRRDRDFDDEELGLLTELRPVVAALDALGAPSDRAAAVGATVLTAREREVLALLARGHKAATIARFTHLSTRTVHRHLSNIYAKLAVTDRLSAVNRGRELGLLSEMP